MRRFILTFTAALLALAVDAGAAFAKPTEQAPAEAQRIEILRGAQPAAPGLREHAPAEAQRIEITVGSGGFTPSLTRVKVGQPVTLVVTRKTDETCATDIVIKDFGVRKALPLNKAVEVTFTPKKPGAIRFACAMDMVAGQIVAE